MAMARIRPEHGEPRDIEVFPGLTLAQTLYLEGFWPVLPMCAGLGRCGLCRARFLSPAPEPTAAERRRLAPEDLAQGWRLACQHPAGEGQDVFLPEPPRSGASRRPSRPEAPGTPPGDAGRASPAGGLALAVDLGTTSIHWSAGRVDSGTFERLASGQDLNPQIGLGSEVMSRLAAARQGLAEDLRLLVLDHIRSLAAGLPEPVSSLAVAGNPAMTALVQGRPVDGLALAPYRLEDAAGEERLLAPDLPPAYLPPLLAPFVGGDLSAGLAALYFGAPDGSRPEHPFLLADMGTNGEFVLALAPDRHLLASVPMGPALEGVGLTHGQVAGPGVAVGFAPGPRGIEPRWLERAPAPDEPRAVSGTGYLSLLALLRTLGLLDLRGAWAEPDTPLGRGLARFVERRGERVLDLGGGLFLPPSDVEEALKVKAAFNLAVSRLLGEAGLTASDLARVYLAGAMGQHASPRDLETLGFLPPGLGDRVAPAGNTSLRGAELFLSRPMTRQWASGLSATCRLVELSAGEFFQRDYLARMVFAYVC